MIPVHTLLSYFRTSGLILSSYLCLGLPSGRSLYVSFLIFPCVLYDQYKIWNGYSDDRGSIPSRGTHIFFSPPRPHQLRDPPSPLSSGHTLPEVKRPERKSDRSPPSTVEDKNAWSYTSTLADIFVARCFLSVCVVHNITQYYLSVDYSKPVWPYPCNKTSLHPIPPHYFQFRIQDQFPIYDSTPCNH
jgi:hypothetical protein